MYTYLYIYARMILTSSKHLRWLKLPEISMKRSTINTSNKIYAAQMLNKYLLTDCLIIKKRKNNTQKPGRN